MLCVAVTKMTENNILWQNPLCKILKFSLSFNYGKQPSLNRTIFKESIVSAIWVLKNCLIFQCQLLCGVCACSVIISVYAGRIQFSEKPLTLGHEDFNGLCYQDIWRQDASRLYGNCERKEINQLIYSITQVIHTTVGTCIYDISISPQQRFLHDNQKSYMKHY